MNTERDIISDKWTRVGNLKNEYRKGFYIFSDKQASVGNHSINILITASVSHFVYLIMQPVFKMLSNQNTVYI